jgi:hypothetical protein
LGKSGSDGRAVPIVLAVIDVGSTASRGPSNASRTSSRCGAIALQPVQVRMGT